jgi:hypothetical protein
MKNNKVTERRAGWDRAKAALPWLALAVLLVIPLYALAISFAIRSGIFKLNDKSISNEEFRALWAFIAAGVGTAATIIGFLLTKSHNDRTLAFQEDLEARKLASQKESDARLTLETVVRGLELMVVSDGTYAPKARIAGSLATLVHLGHPAIAMRALTIIWEEDRVDGGTACWLISEVLRTGSEVSKKEAAELLFLHAETLTREARPFYYDWPDVLIDNWLTDLPLEARLRILAAFVKVVLSQELSWWDSKWWFFAYLDIPVTHGSNLPADLRWQLGNPLVQLTQQVNLGPRIRAELSKPRLELVELGGQHPLSGQVQLSIRWQRPADRQSKPGDQHGTGLRRRPPGGRTNHGTHHRIESGKIPGDQRLK